MNWSELVRWAVMTAVGAAPAMTPVLVRAQAAPADASPPGSVASESPAAAPADQPPIPATQPTAIEPTADAPPAPASPEVIALLQAAQAAYNGLKSAEFKGKLTTDIDVAGRQQKESVDFVSAYSAPNQFRHTFDSENMIVGSTGQKSFAFSKQGNTFIQADVPPEGILTAPLPGPVGTILREQNPSLLLALEEEAFKGFEQAGAALRKTEVTIDGAVFPSLQIQGGAGTPGVTLSFDPSSHLLRRVVTDMKPMLEARGAPDVKSALIMIDYTAATAGAEFPAEHFAWSPPEGATDAEVAAREAAANQPNPKALEGKPAPPLELATLDGKQVSLDQLKGNVVLLDFWATWCAPCIEALPHVAKLAQREDLKVLAVNVAEDTETIQQFLEAQKITGLPVGLDAEGKVAEAYLAFALPQTVVIGKDGTVRKVFLGIGPNTYAELDAIIAELNKESAAAAAPAAPAAESTAE